MFGEGHYEESFFDLGGSSLMALRVSDALAGLGYPMIDPRDVYLHPTVAGLVALIQGD